MIVKLIDTQPKTQAARLTIQTAEIALETTAICCLDCDRHIHQKSDRFSEIHNSKLTFNCFYLAKCRLQLIQHL